LAASARPTLATFLDTRGAARYAFAAVSILRLRRFDRDVGLVLAAFIVLLANENLAIGLGYRAEFVGTWEMGSARLYVSPIALAVSVPFAIVLVGAARLAVAGHARILALAVALAGGTVGVFVSTGRRMASLAIRVPFVVVVAIASGLVAWVLARRLPLMRARVAAALGIAVGSAAWLADAFVLPRLYPAFHLALFGVTLAGWALAALLVRDRPQAEPIAFGGIVVAAASIAWSPHAAVKTSTEDNLRRVLLEHAPFLGRAVVIANELAPPPPLEEDEIATTTLTSLRRGKGTRSLDWRGRDIFVVTIDALRADHVSAYGYARKTTPNIDALAARGVRFERAYCPTPHTSYSIASMMTGRYMKPLLALGADTPDETWALLLRRYGYRTAGFYPPAVFFIDEHRFARMRDAYLGFEYYKQEFATTKRRLAQVERYLSSASRDKPVFVWVHLFEPHEPYEMHDEHPFSGDPRFDAYDSEIAAADAFVGDLVKLVEEKRPPGTVFVVSADHGEEHGDHGGRYHGTTVYEEQVRVPLVVVAPEMTPKVVQTPVQTIDLVPTTLAALDVPRPPRLRGRDLGPVLVGTEDPSEEGLAFAETDDYTLVARGTDRLVCARKIGSCTLFDIARDPAQRQPVVDRPARVAELKKLTAAIEREMGKVEASALPEALRRGLQGDRDAAEDVAPLLDDARVDIRRLAARCAYRLKAPEIAAQLRRALARDEDEEVRRWCALALARLGEAADAGTAPAMEIASLLASSDVEERTAAALVLAERGDARGERVLVARWNAAFGPATRSPGEIDEARELLAAFANLRSKQAVPDLVRSLQDVRLRPFVVETLAKTGDARAKAPLLRAFAAERYLHLRPLEARALLDLGARQELYEPLARFAGTPEPMLEAIAMAREAKLLTPERGGMEWPEPRPPAPTATDSAPPRRTVTATVRLSKPGPTRLLALGGGGSLTVTVGGAVLPEVTASAGDVWIVEVGELKAGAVRLSLESTSPVLAVWLVPRAAEIPPPPPEAWEARPGAEPPESSDENVDGGL
jgi:arylsulfatase A-like enzyme